MDVDLTSINWQMMFDNMEAQGITTAREVLDHCHIAEFYRSNGLDNEYGATLCCCSGTYERVIEPTFANGIRRALKDQFRAKNINLWVIDLDKAFFCD